MPEALAGVRVLVVDDDDDTRLILNEVLGHLGADVATAASAQDALALAQGVDIIVTDIAMPSVDGVWLLERVNELPRPVPVIAMSGYAERQVPRYARAPFARKLLKPVDKSELSDLIREVLRERR